MTPIPRATKPLKIQRLSTQQWQKGVVTSLDRSRTPVDGLLGAGNAVLGQNGTIRPRPSLVRYGTQPPGTILGELFEFVRREEVDGEQANVTYLLALCNVSNVTKAYYSKDGGVWTVLNGKVFSNTAKAHFCQVDNKVLIMNKVDNLSYVNIPTLEVVPFVGLTTPSAPSVTPTGLTGTTFSYWYQISANSSVGETAASVAVQVQVGKQREIWIAASEYVTLTWTAVTNARSYNVYMSPVDPAAGGIGTLIASGISGTKFVDDATKAPDFSKAAQFSDTTAGPIVERGTVINGQVFLTGDKDNPDYVRFGGQGDSILDFSPYGDGGYSQIGRGTKELPVRVMSFRDGQGHAQTTVLCRGTNGTGKRYLMSPSTVTFGDTIISYFAIVEDNGQIGTDSPDGVVLYRDALWYPSRDGFKTTGTKPQLQNILSTDTVSETIIDDTRLLNNVAMGGAVGLAYQGLIYWALPNGTTSNSEIWVLDLNREGAWMKPWSVAASWMTLYNDNFGQTHHLVLGTNNVIYEFSYAQLTLDDNKPFSASIASGLTKFSEDSLEWGKVIDVTFIILRPQGVMYFNVSGETEDNSNQPLGSEDLDATAETSVAGWSEAGWGGSPGLDIPAIYGWSDWSEVPVVLADPERKVTIEIDEEVNNIKWEAGTSGAGADGQISDVIIRYVPIGVKDLT